jgi:hypothetical protein
MKTAVTILGMIARVLGLVMIVLGLLFWFNIAKNLVGIHMLVGMMIVVLLWVFSIIGAFRGAHWGRVVFGIIWGFVVIWLGMTQTGLLPGSLHWVIQVLHLAVGLVALAQIETFGRIIRNSFPAQQRSETASA